MTGPIYAVVRTLLSVLPVDHSGRRVFDETLADWRREAANVSGHLARLAVSVRAIVSVVRGVVMISAREAFNRHGLASLGRLGAWSAMAVLLFVAFNFNRAIPVQGVHHALQRAIGLEAIVLGSVSWVVALLPLLAFMSAASGRQHTARIPRLGPAVVAGVVMLGAMGWAMPAANQAWRETMFALNGGTGPIAQGINERSMVELVGLLTSSQFSSAASALNLRLVFIVAVPVLLVLGLTARSLGGRWRLAASVLPLLVFAIPFMVRIDSPYGHASSWPALIAAVLLTRAIERRAARVTA